MEQTEEGKGNAKVRKRGKRWPVVLSLSIVGVVLLYFSGGIVAANVVSDIVFGGRASSIEDLEENYLYALEKTQKDYPLLQDREILTFPSGNEKLTGYFYSAAESKGTVISLHGLSSLSDGDDAEYQNLFVEMGYQVFAVDLHASGRSEGDSSIGLHQSAYDAHAAYSYLEKEGKLTHPLIMVGHSWGAFGAVASLSLGVEADCVISFSAYENPMETMGQYAVNYVGEIAYATFPPFMVGMGMRYGGNAGFSAKSALENSPKTKALLIHGKDDEDIRLEHSLCHYAEGLENVETLVLDGVTHDRPWISVESSAYVEDALRKIDIDAFKAMSIAEREKALNEIGYEKDKGSILSTPVVNAIESFLE